MKKYFLGLGVICVMLAGIVMVYNLKSTIPTDSNGEVVSTQLMNAIRLQHSQDLKVLEIGSSEISNEFANYNLKMTSLSINGPIEAHLQSLLNYEPYPGVFKLADSFTNKNNINVRIIEPGVADKDVMLFYLVLFDHREGSRHDYSYGFEIKCLDVSEDPLEKNEFSIFSCDQAKILAQEVADSVDIFDQTAMDDYIDQKIRTSDVD